MRVLVTGANGFVGRALAQSLGQGPVTRLVLTDQQMGAVPLGAEAKPGDLTDPAFLDDLTCDGFDLVYHLASLPGAKAEAEAELGHRVNLLAPLSLARAVARAKRGARFVFASSIAVYGAVHDTVTPSTPPCPALTYGAHKWMTEIALTDLTRRGDLSAISLRLPGIVARPATETGHGSAFMSQLFHKVAAGVSYDCPVPAAVQCWWMSRRACVAAFIHAAGLTAADTVIQPPVLHLTCGDVVAAAGRVTGQVPWVTWGQDSRLTALFGAMPALDAAPALRLGFRADADATDLARHALNGDPV